MKYRTVTERIGERLSDIDWSYDFTSHDWGDGKGGHNPDSSRRATKLLREMEEAFKAGKRVSVRMYDVFEPVVDVGMYDGWPYWRPVPSFQSCAWLGPSWHDWLCISELQIEPELSTQ